MKVLILSQYFWPENFRINDAAIELSRRKHAVTVLTGLPNYPRGEVYPDYRSDPERFAALHSVKVIRVPMLARGKGVFSLVGNYLSFAASAAVVGGWKLGRRDFDVLLVFQPSPATVALPAVVLGWLKRAPIVFWVQDLWPETLAAVGVVRSPALLGVVGAFMRWVYARSDHVLAQSRSLCEHLRDRVRDPTRVSHLPNWSPPPQPGESHSEGTDGETFNIFYLGNIGQAQDLPSVLAAASQLQERRDIHWHFVGDGRLHGWLQAEVAKSPLRDRIHMHGAFPQDRLHRFYSSANALLVSLRSDPIFAMTVPSKLQAYLELGVPIVAMLDGEGADVVREAGAGLAVPAGDSAGLARAVRELTLLSREERAAMGARGQAFGREHFDFSRLMDRLEQILAGSRRR